MNRDDDFADVFRVLKMAAVVWFGGALTCGMVYAVWRGWSAFWAAFAEMYWAGMP